MNTTKPTPSDLEPTHVACAVCLKEVPLSEALVPEASDYFVHFCGLDCFAQWEHRQKSAAQDEKNQEKK